MNSTLFEQLMAISATISDQYTEVLTQTDLLQTATYWHNLSKNTLEIARRAVLVEYADNVKALGANEAVREARLDDLTAPQRAHVDEFAVGVASATHALRIATLGLEDTRCQLRIIECAVAAKQFDGRNAASAVHSPLLADVDPDRFDDVILNPGTPRDGQVRHE